jgi:hypothetical protein
MGTARDDNGVEVEDIFPERPRPKRHITLRTDIRGCYGGVKEAMWVQTGPHYVNTVRVGIPRPEGFVDAVVPIDMLREALNKLEEFDPESED